MVKNKIPKRGDIVWLDFSPQAGHEQAGRRPALVLSPLSYNEKSNLLLACPITKTSKGYPFEIELPKKYKLDGVILSDHLRSLDWKARNVEIVDKISKEIIDEVINKLRVLI